MPPEKPGLQSAGGWSALRRFRWRWRVWGLPLGMWCEGRREESGLEGQLWCPLLATHQTAALCQVPGTEGVTVPRVCFPAAQPSRGDVRKQ